MVLISIVRHGETAFNDKKIIQGHLEISLNEKGEKQAYLLAKRLDDQDISKILSSDLLRAKQTAEIISKYHHDHPSITYHKELRERNLGIWEGKPFEEYLKEKQKNKEFEPEGAESFHEFWERVEKAKNLIVQEALNLRDEKQHLLVVSHGGTIRRILTAFFFPSYREPFPMRVDNTSLTQIELIQEIINGELKKEFIIKTLNNTCHLIEKTEQPNLKF